MNHAALPPFVGGTSTRVALEEHVLQPGNDADLCARGPECKPFKKTKEGRERFKILQERWKEHERELQNG